MAAGSAFCGDCGQALADAAPAEQPADAIESGPRLNKPVIIGSCVILAVALVGAVIGSSEKAEKSADAGFEQTIASNEPGNAASDGPVTGQSGEPSTSAQSNAGCSGFVDGSSRDNALAGVALGDSFARVAQQLRCGELGFELAESQVTRGGDYAVLYEKNFIQHYEGSNGDEYVQAVFVGEPDNQALVRFTRGGNYKNSPPPSVENLVKSIITKYPKSRMLGESQGWVRFTNIGYGFAVNGDKLSDSDAISCNSYLHQDDECGPTFLGRVYPDVKNNPGLVKEYTITIYNRYGEKSAENAAKARLEQLETQRMDAEVQGSANVRGL